MKSKYDEMKVKLEAANELRALQQDAAESQDAAAESQDAAAESQDAAGPQDLPYYPPDLNRRRVEARLLAEKDATAESQDAAESQEAAGSQESSQEPSSQESVPTSEEMLSPAARLSKRQNEKFMQQIEEHMDRADKAEKGLAEVAKSKAIHKEKMEAGGVIAQGLFWEGRFPNHAKGKGKHVPDPPIYDKEGRNIFYGEYGEPFYNFFGVRCKECDFHFPQRCWNEWGDKFGIENFVFAESKWGPLRKAEHTCQKCPWCLGLLPMEVVD